MEDWCIATVAWTSCHCMTSSLCRQIVRERPCCQCCGLPTELGYFEIASCRSKNCWVGGLKLGYFFSFKFASFLSIQRVSDPLQTPKKILFINFTDYDNLESNQYPLSTSRGSQQSICFSTQLGDFNYFMTEKHPNLENWAYNYLIKIGLLCQFATVWCSEVLAALEKECKHFKQCMGRQRNVWQHPKCGREKWKHFIIKTIWTNPICQVIVQTDLP